jgi:hypothetical protein
MDGEEHDIWRREIVTFRDHFDVEYVDDDPEKY